MLSFERNIYNEIFHGKHIDNLKAAMQGCKRFEPKKVMKNNSHARVVGSIIKTAAKKSLSFSAINVNSDKMKTKGTAVFLKSRTNLGISGSQKLRYLSSKT
jgi:hypothetical protein